jgi:hypothetical protein
MSLLARIGLTKEEMERMVGPVKPFVNPTPKRKKRMWKRIPDDMVARIKKEHPTMTNKELAKKYKISESAAWTARNLR